MFFYLCGLKHIFFLPMNSLIELDSRLFLFLNSLHVRWLDGVMVAITEMWAWAPLYVLLIYWTVRQFGRQCWWVFLAVGFVVLCSDQLSAHVCKPFFQRLRPCHNIDLQDFIYRPTGKAVGRFGFVSSHAANTFSVAAFLTGVLGKQRPWIWIVLYFWALLSSYSRIYMGFHYPADIFFGALLGIMVGLVLWRLFQIVQRKAWKSEQ